MRRRPCHLHNIESAERGANFEGKVNFGRHHERDRAAAEVRRHAPRARLQYGGAAQRDVGEDEGRAEEMKVEPCPSLPHHIRLKADEVGPIADEPQPLELWRRVADVEMNIEARRHGTAHAARGEPSLQTRLCRHPPGAGAQAEGLHGGLHHHRSPRPYAATPSWLATAPTTGGATTTTMTRTGRNLQPLRELHAACGPYASPGAHTPMLLWRP